MTTDAPCPACGRAHPAGPCGRTALDALTVALPAALTHAPQPAEPDHTTLVTLEGAPLATRLVSDPLLPDRVDAFALEYAIGTGGSATVYRARDVNTGAPVAVKVLRRGSADDPQVLQRMGREVAALGRIDHPGVVCAVGAGRLPDGRPWVAMPLLEGTALDVILEDRGPLPWGLVVPVLDELAGALKAAHTAGVVHRDVKPGNVFLATGRDGEVRVRLLDFGLALLGNAAEGVPQTSVTSTAGTPEFSAPEQALGQAVTGAADLYALGVTGWQLLTGRLPFGAESGTEARRRHVLDELPPLPRQLGVPGPVRDVIRRLVAKQPAARPSPTDIQRALRGLPLAWRAADGALGTLAARWAREHPPTLRGRVLRWWAW